jgi:hypothetical protein
LAQNRLSQAKPVRSERRQKQAAKAKTAAADSNPMSIVEAGAVLQSRNGGGGLQSEGTNHLQERRLQSWEYHRRQIRGGNSIHMKEQSIIDAALDEKRRCGAC